jgi:PD-(D/E)XK nuclease family transposase
MTRTLFLSRLFPITDGSPLRFKVVFGNERNTLFLRRALQALIQSEVPIVDVSFDRNTFDAVVKDSRSRGGIYDLACVDENGTHFIVEMQVSDAPYFLQRMNRGGGPLLRLPQVQLVGPTG